MDLSSVFRTQYRNRDRRNLPTKRNDTFIIKATDHLDEDCVQTIFNSLYNSLDNIRTVKIQQEIGRPVSLQILLSLQLGIFQLLERSYGVIEIIFRYKSSSIPTTDYITVELDYRSYSAKYLQCNYLKFDKKLAKALETVARKIVRYYPDCEAHVYRENKQMVFSIIGTDSLNTRV